MFEDDQVDRANVNGVMFLIKLNAHVGAFFVKKAETTEFGFFYQVFTGEWNAVVETGDGTLVLYANINKDDFDIDKDTPFSRFESVDAIVTAYLKQFKGV